MAIIYTYPDATPKATDKLIGTVTEDVNAVNVVKGNPTRSFTLSGVQSLFNQDVVNVVVPVTATVFKTLTNAAPITLLAAPGTGKAYDVQDIVWYTDGGTIPFNTSAGSGDIYIDGPWTSTSTGIPRATVINVTSTKILFHFADPTNPGGADASYIMQQNAPLVLKANGTTTTTGNGIIYISITYKIVNTTASMV
jgi:hypothetical protein